MGSARQSRLFGDRETFAIEVETVIDQVSSEQLARLSYWLLSQQLVSPDFYDSLDIVSAMKWVRHDCGNRQGGVLCNLPDAQIHAFIQSVLRDDQEGQSVPLRNLPRDVARFNLFFHPTHGEGWLFLLGCNELGRLLYRGSDTAPLLSLVTSLSFAESCIVNAYSYLDVMTMH